MTEYSKKISRGLVRGTVAITANRVIDAVIGLMIVPFTLHRLGYDAYGLWALIYAITTYMNLADFGFSSSLNRHFSKALTSGEEKESKEVLSTAFFTMLGLAFLIFLIGLALEYPVLRFFKTVSEFGRTGVLVYRAMIVTLSVAFLANYFRSAIVASQRADRLALLQTIVTIGNAGMIVFVLTSGWGVVGLAYGSAAFTLVRISIFVLGAKSCIKPLVINIKYFRKEIFKSMWKFGIVVQFARVTDLINMQFDRLLLGRVMNLQTVSFYDVGAKAANVTSTISNILVYVVEPAAAALHTTGDKGRFESLINKSGKYVSLLTFPLIIYVTFNAEVLLNLWLGSIPNSNMVLALRFLVFSYAFMSLTLPLRLAARGAGFPKWESKYLMIQALMNMTVSIALFYLYGLKGILVGTLMAGFISQTLLALAILKGLELSRLKYMFNIWIKPLIIAFIPGVMSYLVLLWTGTDAVNPGRIEVLPSIISSFATFVPIYLGLTFILRLFSVDEFKDLLSKMR